MEAWWDIQTQGQSVYLATEHQDEASAREDRSENVSQVNRNFKKRREKNCDNMKSEFTNRAANIPRMKCCTAMRFI